MVASTRAFPRNSIALLVLMSCHGAWAEDYFDPELLSLGTGTSEVDLSAFSHAGGVAEGDYLVTIFVNQREAESRDLVFKKNSQGNVAPLLTPELLKTLGVNVDQLPALKELPKDQPVDNLTALIPQSTVKFDLSRLRLDVSIPQVAMQPGRDSQSDPAQWDDGIPAMLFNYNLSAGRNEQTVNNDQRATNNVFANVQTGANAGAWRLRSTITHSHSDTDSGNNTDSTRFSNTYLARDIRDWRSRLLMGEASTGGDVLDGVPFRGVQLRSADQMMPARLRGFAPQINGVANSNARVTVRQNGYVVYETYVAPGPFEIKDLYQAGMSGDLDVAITEADGSVHSFVVPYSSLPVMLRPGAVKYEVTAGQYDGGTTQGSRQSDFVLATLIYGLPKNLTLYGGLLTSQKYSALSMGSGVSLGDWGAMSADGTFSSTQFEDKNRQGGASWRVRYSKSMLTTGTSVDLTALRYSTRNYYSFSEYNSLGYAQKEDVSPWIMSRRRSSFQTQVTQQLGDFGSVSLRANRDDYYGSTKTLTSLSAGYNGSVKGISYGIYYTVDRMKGNGDWPENRQVSFNVSIPFSIFSYSSALQNTYASSQFTHDNQGRTQGQAGIAGSNADGAFSYSVMQGWGNQDQVSSSTANLGYQGSKGNISAGYGYSADMRSMNVNMSGGAVVHSEGVTLSRPLGSSVALISAPGAEGVSLSNNGGKSDSRGYAVVPYLSDYTRNNIGLDPSTLPDNVDLPQNQQTVYPTNGAVVKANFATRIGYQVLMTLTRAGGAGVVPFGATVALVQSATSEENTGITGDNGQVYLTGLPQKGELSVMWGKGHDKQCRVSYNLHGLAPTAQMPVIQMKGECR
ncbi:MULTISPECIES: fimbria/pilus outer membrane usher protein [Rahnella]|uniref:Fimbrial biogenesis outer membrane usher protein n=1 Tax=Rahnella laticis TaxID=2787622 RepID=A0ABS0E7W9_9GAMM|nr:MULTISPECIES: fimbria/pilus outer membrane usher protein [Rahnella]MBF7981185.1 fimbrial biogenesis outer membrane usher protein [Rahnella laticis]MBF8001052.1 fimbrial biogenesis outer membrane usher protein [Rahnella sp. LAC-M12]